MKEETLGRLGGGLGFACVCCLRRLAVAQPKALTVAAPVFVLSGKGVRSEVALRERGVKSMGNSNSSSGSRGEDGKTLPKKKKGGILCACGKVTSPPWEVVDQVVVEAF